MKFYVVEVPTPYNRVPFTRYLETSKAGLNQRLLDILQRDAFGGNPHEHAGKPRVFTIDIPTPVKQSTVESLIKGEIYQYVVDENGEPDPQPNPWKPENRRTLKQVLGAVNTQVSVEEIPALPTSYADEAIAPAGLAMDADRGRTSPAETEDGETVSEAELEKQGQEPLPF